MSRHLGRLLCLLGLGLLAAHACAKPTEVRIGVLAFRSIDSTYQTWQPTAEYLDQAVPGYHFRLMPMHNEDLEKAVDAHAVDFVFTQPEQYVVLRSAHGLAALATLMPVVDGRPLSEFGGVIFSRADSPIHGLDDLRGKRVYAVYDRSLGAYRAQQWTLLKAGIHLPEDVRALRFTGQPQDRVVKEILAGNGDVGFVRTGVLEAMAREGKLDLTRLRLINAQTQLDFPQLLSTDLYPEWPFSAMRGVSDKLAKAVTLALLNMPSDAPAAQAGKYYGFAPPGDYTPLEAMLLRLKAHPGRLNQFDLSDIVDKYHLQLAALLFLLVLLISKVMLRLKADNRRIQVASHERGLLLASLAEGVCGFDRDGRCTFANAAALQMLGYAEHELVGSNQRNLFRFVHEGSNALWDETCPLRATLNDGQRRQGEAQVADKSGEALPVSYSITPLRERDTVRGVVVAFQDIRRKKQADADLRVAAVAFETQEGMLITDRQARILRVNQAFTQVTGYDPGEVLGYTPAILKSGRHDVHFYRDLWATLKAEGSWRGEIWNRRKSGEIYPQWLTITGVADTSGEINHYVGTFLDISQRKRAEQQIEYMALYDLLTGLPNRRLLLERLSQTLASRARANRYGALLFIDLDNFKNLNDTLGHDMGDELLKQAADRLRGAVREGDTVARLGGDEFVVMLDDLGENPEEAAAMAELVGEKLLAGLNRAYLLGGHERHSGASLGLTLFHNHDFSIEELLKRADMAMYQAKSAGRNTLRFFDPTMQSAVEARAQLENELRRALKQREFLLHYQPQVDSQGHVQGFEALVRWQHPQRGLVNPGEFIPLAESSGLILPLGNLVMAAACEQLASWQRQAVTASLSISVNVSARQFRQTDFVERVVALLLQSGANPAGLKIELTESLMLEGVEDVIAKMKALKDLGVGFSLDDFGTGYSSLTYLKRLPLDQIKIDQSFVRDALDNPNDATITRTVLALGETFGLEVIAEGVETDAQRDFLLTHGCRNFQGYLFGRPQALSELNLPD